MISNQPPARPGSRVFLELALVFITATAALVSLTARSSGSPLPWYYGGNATETIFVELGESIQDAIDAAADGWIVDLAYGVHYGENLDLRGKRIRVRGAIGVDGYGQPYGLSTIRPIGYARVFDIHQEEGPETILEHLIIERGSVFGSIFYGEPLELGGGMRIQSASPTLRNLVFRNNSANIGGALALEGTSHPTILDCEFDRNTAGEGGGIAILDTSAPLIERVRVANNAAYGEPLGRGGGVYAADASQAVIYDGVICGNWPDQIDGFVVLDGDACVNETCDIDCNGNGVCDAIDIATGASSDCDGDGIPDECRPTTEAGWSGSRNGFPRNNQSFDYSIPARESPLPVRLSIRAIGDLGSTSEYLTLQVGTYETRVETEYDCDYDYYDYEIPSVDWNMALQGSNLSLSLQASGGVGYYCSNQIRFRVTYALPDELDSDGDGAADCVDPCPDIPYDCDADRTTLVLAPGMDIQTAIDLFPETTTIEFVGGLYRVTAPLDPRGQPIRFVGAVDAEGRPITILDGEGRNQLLKCVSGETDATIFENLVFTQGRSDHGEIGNSVPGGGGIILSPARPAFLNCDFTNCLNDVSYWRGYTYEGSGGGGAIFTNSAPSFDSCRFVDNLTVVLANPTVGRKATGGAVHVAAGGRPRFLGCHFDSNAAICQETHENFALGGAVYASQAFPMFDDCVFTANLAESEFGTGGSGGGLLAVGGEVLIERSTFAGNAAERGGAVHMSAPNQCEYTSISRLTIDDCLITGNQALEAGGVMVSKDGLGDYDIDCPDRHELIVRITDSFIQGNAGSGLDITAPLIDDSANLEVSITGGAITDNLGYGDGGGVTVENATVRIDGATIGGNFATYGGGVHAGAWSIVDLVDCTIQNNTALQGGGILAFLPDRLALESTLVCLNAPNQIVGTFEDLGENCIGPLCLDSDSDGVLDCLDDCPDDPEKIEPGICGCGVTDVDTDGDGTADCLDGCPDDPEKIEPGACGCGVPDTDSDGDGIADCNDDCPAWPYDCVDEGSTLVVDPGEPIDLAISVANGGDTIRLTAGRHETPTTIDLLGKAIALAGETDGSGEPISTIDADGRHRVLRCTTGEGVNTVIRDLVITGGSDALGGGVYLVGSSPRLVDCRIEFNSASIGGGLYCSSGSNPEVTGCRIENNTVTDLGGGVFSSASLPLFVDSRVCGNSPDQIFGPYEQAGDSCADALCDACFTACPADLDGDGEVAGSDLGLLLVAWGACDEPSCPADLDGDGVVGGADLGVFLVNIGPCDGD